MLMNKKERINALLDWYSVLLTEKQAHIASLYYREDYSLAEIAQHTNSSRSAIHDALKRVEYVVEIYESQLHLLERFQQRSELYQQLRALHSEAVDPLIDKLEQQE
jgi:predicted DNA-binding protein YlxM (UPF0122 family)